VHLAGNSLGGWIAVELARRGRAWTVAALAPAGLEAPPHRIVVIGLNEVLRSAAVLVAATGLVAGRVARTALLAGLHARPWRLSAAAGAQEVFDLAGAPAFHATLKATVGAEVASGLDEIAVPVSVLVGTHDLVIGGPSAPSYAAAIPGAVLQVLPGCGHVPMADDPQLAARAILASTRR
jgi:pimeloyl-ACP methyl ester carboxylesterase